MRLGGGRIPAYEPSLAETPLSSCSFDASGDVFGVSSQIAFRTHLGGDLRALAGVRSARRELFQKGWIYDTSRNTYGKTGFAAMIRGQQCGAPLPLSDSCLDRSG